MAGIFAALIFSCVFKLQGRKTMISGFCFYTLGLLAVIVPYFWYLSVTHSLSPYFESVYTVVTNMQNIINPHVVSEYPHNFPEALRAMLTPTSKNFRHMSPSYFYLALLIYLIYRTQKKRLTTTDINIVCVGVYGFVMYNAAFRSIWASQFEMALQPEKILFFFILEEALFYLDGKKEKFRVDIEAAAQTFIPRLKVYFISFLFVGFVISSLGYSIDRYNKRFFAFKYLRNVIMRKDTKEIMPLGKVPSRALAIERAKGMVVPLEQANELEAIDNFFRKTTTVQETVLMYPELGTYSFLIDRPFLGRFPISTFSWFNDKWYEEFVLEFKKAKPRYIVLQKKFPPNWNEVYLALEANRKKYEEVMNLIDANYVLKTITPQSHIYEIKSAPEARVSKKVK